MHDATTNGVTASCNLSSSGNEIALLRPGRAKETSQVNGNAGKNHAQHAADCQEIAAFIPVVNFDNIPAELKSKPQWVFWALCPDAKRGKPTKVPYQVNGRLAKTNDPKTWTTYKAVVEYVRPRLGAKHGNGKVGGIGFVLSEDDDIVGVDLDHVLEDFEVTDQVQEYIDILDTYTEVSPSGTGIRMFCRGKLPPGARKNGCAEVYEHGRFLTVTGNVLGEARAIECRQAELERFHALAFPKKEETKQKTSSAPVQSSGDFIAERLALARKSRSGAAFSALYDRGEVGDDHSAADMTLCNWLAFWLDRDASAIDTAFRASALMRQKWDARHYEDGRTYGQGTIARAIDDCRDTYKPKKSSRTKEDKQEDHELFTEDFLATQFARDYGQVVRFDHERGKWHIWNGHCWEMDSTGKTVAYIRSTCQKFADRTKSPSEAVQILKANTVRNVNYLARYDRAVAVSSGIWDTDKYLLGTPQGTVDLRTGKTRSAYQLDYITKQTSVVPADTVNAPLWMQFLDETTNGNDEFKTFLQRIAGYALTGDISEHALFFIYGPGGNGKSVFIDTIVNILGSYATTAPMDTFIERKGESHPTDLAMLRGARLVTASETESGRAWAESRIKQLTGGDRISARFMRQDFFEFNPQFKLLIIGNHAPTLRNVDDAIRRRFNVLPFVNKPTTVDKQLPDKLRSEYPAILRWMIDGCVAWKSDGLARPDVVVSTTGEYFDSQDVVGAWIAESCFCGANVRCNVTELFSSWRAFCESNGEAPGTAKTFKADLLRRGFQYNRVKAGRFFFGIGLTHREL